MPLPQTANPNNFYLNPPQIRRTKTRVFASGTLFQTHTFTVPSFPVHTDSSGNSHPETSVVRAHSVTKSLNGSAPGILALLAQFNELALSATQDAPSSTELETYLVAPLGGSDEGKAIRNQLERDGIRTQYCKIVEGAGVPGAWVFKSKAMSSKTVVLHNPLLDLTHEEFVSSLGPILIPENYALMPSPSSPSPSQAHTLPLPDAAPFEWLHFEGRSIKTTLNNLQGLDGLARDRGWRGKVVFSLDVGGVSNNSGAGQSGGGGKRQGVEALIPFVDVVFFDKAYALSHGYTSPRPFLLSMASLAASHALLIINWSSPFQSYDTSDLSTQKASVALEGGAALLSLPTREYLQSSPFAPPPNALPSSRRGPNGEMLGGEYDDVLDISSQHSAFRGPRDARNRGVESVRSGSEFYADGHRSSVTASSSFGFAPDYGGHSSRPSDSSTGFPGDRRGAPHLHKASTEEGWDMYTVSHTPSFEEPLADPSEEGDLHTPESRERERHRREIEDGPGEGSAFIASMIFGLTRRLMPGNTWVPGGTGTNVRTVENQGRVLKALGNQNDENRRWGLDECLRFATELTGRRRHLTLHHHYYPSRRQPPRTLNGHPLHSHRPHDTSDGRALNEEVVLEMRDVGWF